MGAVADGARLKSELDGNTFELPQSLDKKRLETLRLQEDLAARVDAEKQRVAAATSRRLETIRVEVEQLLKARNQMEQQLRDKIAIRLEHQRELTTLLSHGNLPEGVVAYNSCGSGCPVASTTRAPDPLAQSQAEGR